jgi:hypothetical protein
MQTAVSDPKLRAGSDESSTSSRVSSRAAVQPDFTHRRGRKRLDLSWRVKLAVAVSVSALIAVSLLVQV